MSIYQVETQRCNKDQTPKWVWASPARRILKMDSQEVVEDSWPPQFHLKGAERVRRFCEEVFFGKAVLWEFFRRGELEGAALSSSPLEVSAFNEAAERGLCAPCSPGTLRPETAKAAEWTAVSGAWGLSPLRGAGRMQGPMRERGTTAWSRFNACPGGSPERWRDSLGNSCVERMLESQGLRGQWQLEVQRGGPRLPEGSSRGIWGRSWEKVRFQQLPGAVQSQPVQSTTYEVGAMIITIILQSRNRRVERLCGLPEVIP